MKSNSSILPTFVYVMFGESAGTTGCHDSGEAGGVEVEYGIQEYVIHGGNMAADFSNATGGTARRQSNFSTK